MGAFSFTPRFSEVVSEYSIWPEPFQRLAENRQTGSVIDFAFLVTSLKRGVNESLLAPTRPRPA